MSLKAPRLLSITEDGNTTENCDKVIKGQARWVVRASHLGNISDDFMYRRSRLDLNSDLAQMPMVGQINHLSNLGHLPKQPEYLL